MELTVLCETLSLLWALGTEALLPRVVDLRELKRRIFSFPVIQITPIADSKLLELLTELGFEESISHTKTVAEESSTSETILGGLEGSESDLGNGFTGVRHLVMVVKVGRKRGTSFIKVGFQLLLATGVCTADVLRGLRLHNVVDVLLQLGHLGDASIGQVNDLLSLEGLLHLSTDVVVV